MEKNTESRLNTIVRNEIEPYVDLHNIEGKSMMGTFIFSADTTSDSDDIHIGTIMLGNRGVAAYALLTYLFQEDDDTAGVVRLILSNAFKAHEHGEPMQEIVDMFAANVFKKLHKEN